MGADRLAQWYMPDLLLIGDAIQEAVMAANELARTLDAGTLQLDHLTTVQRQREWPTRVIQAFKAQIQRRIVAPARNTNTPL